MKSGFKAAIAVLIALRALQPTAWADDQPPATRPLTNQADRVSYSVGLLIANNIIKRNGVEVDVDLMAQAIKDALAGRETRLTEQQAQETMRAYEQEMQAKRQQERIKLADKNRKEGEAFLAANRQKPGVKTHEVKLSETSTAELQYTVLAEGAGAPPQAGDMAVMNLKGTLINGKEFDNAANRKMPIGRLQPGLREALLLMKPGAKWQVWLPATLAYGDFAFGAAVEPGAALIYELEFVGVDVPQPLTSDIVMVPSADQIKAGSNIMVIKPEDVKKMMTTNSAPAPAKRP